MDWNTTALVFPGQGSQAVGMVQSLAERYPEARAVLDQADQITGSSFSSLMFNGPAAELDDTINTQPALYIAGIAAYRALIARLGGDESSLPFAAGAGHSLGELTALTAFGSLSFEEGLLLVRERARLMKEAGEQSPGAMAALLGIDTNTAREVCLQASTQTGKPLVVANDNCPGQVVISGDEVTLDVALPIAKERGAKRAVKLAVSIAAHSPLMQPAQAQFREALDRMTFNAPRSPVIGNTTARALVTPEQIKAELGDQLTGAVLWTESVQALRALGVTHILELGSKDVLTGLIRRIDKDLTATPIFTAEALELFVGSISGTAS